MGTNEVYGQSLASWLSTYALTNTLTVETQFFDAVTSNLTDVQVSSYTKWMLLKSTGCKVFILHCISSYAGSALIAAKLAGILDNEEVSTVLCHIRASQHDI
jgi:hypothetical protein